MNPQCCIEAAHVRKQIKIAGCAGLANENMLVEPGVAGPGCPRCGGSRLAGNVTKLAHAAVRLLARIYIICVAAGWNRAVAPEEMN